MDIDAEGEGGKKEEEKRDEHGNSEIQYTKYDHLMMKKRRRGSGIRYADLFNVCCDPLF